MNKGERAIAIDEVSLDWCFRPGVKLDFTKKPEGHVVTAQEVDWRVIEMGERRPES